MVLAYGSNGPDITVPSCRRDVAPGRTLSAERTVSLADSPDDEQPVPRIRLFGRDIALPRSWVARNALGVGLILLGILGFLPVLGFWMIPLGLFVLANDFPSVRRFNRRAGVWIRRKFQRRR